ncbi:hypothetical protein COEREDRAFT_79416 [Coemansia reversa NRRL 1564]|uniref:Uncharacterized protein n=1 Tax=Coemansia reversa (strain ATCC 12441 / NRRL 1564) TaxID=763665 RepID=A0A2G5BIN8_COERN|nr:hypothetical protein COEREDRAFT_79416 [Coemansia reversa NRRL 1564]|eukprot:PIA18866.1 hypothetical protein COEREDRAFT_79416 [Coemansia reversa NRRL 1564]
MPIQPASCPIVEQTVSSAEQPILNTLIGIRNRLAALKKDRGNYYRPDDIVGLYNELLVQVKHLQAVRADEHHDNDTFKNRLDSVLDECFQLFSLFYLALGKNKEIPATYVQLVTIKQNFELMNDTGIYIDDDLSPFQIRLTEIRQLVDTETNKEYEDNDTPRPEILLVSRRLRQCEKELALLEETTRVIDDALTPVYSELIHIRRRLTVLSFLSHDSAMPEAKDLQKRLIEIDDLRVDDRFVDSESGKVAAGQTQVVGLLEECFDRLHDLMAEGSTVPKDMMPLYDRLMEIRVQLEKLLLTSRWTLRETDLWSYQVQLQDIDAMRRNGQFKDTSGDPAPQQAQAALNFLLHKCYNLVYKLLSSSEPVAESLMPVHNQLRTLRRCLLEVKKYGGPMSVRDLYPYQMKLSSIDNLRNDGKFLDDEGHIPEGQGVVMSLLNECYDLMYELMAAEVDE